MRVVFLTNYDPYGYLADYSLLLNQYTDIVSNCITLYDDYGFQPSDVVIKRLELGNQIAYKMPDRIDFTNDFLQSADVLILSDNFDAKEWPVKVKFKGLNRPILGYVSGFHDYGDRIPSFCTVRCFTNQPSVVERFRQKGVPVKYIEPLLSQCETTQTSFPCNLFYSNIYSKFSYEPLFRVCSYILNEYPGMFNFRITGERNYTSILNDIMKAQIIVNNIYGDGLITKQMLIGIANNADIIGNFLVDISEMFNGQKIVYTNIDSEKSLYLAIKSNIEKRMLLGYSGNGSSFRFGNIKSVVNGLVEFLEER